jgi:hypothetical protein
LSNIAAQSIATLFYPSKGIDSSARRICAMDENFLSALRKAARHAKFSPLLEARGFL